MSAEAVMVKQIRQGAITERIASRVTPGSAFGVNFARFRISDENATTQYLTDEMGEAIGLLGNELKPTTALENNDQHHDYGSHGCQYTKISVMPGQFRHELDIHSVDAGQQGKWEKYDRGDSEYTHDVIEPVGGETEMRVQQVGCQLLVELAQAGQTFQVLKYVGELVLIQF